MPGIIRTILFALIGLLSVTALMAPTVVMADDPGPEAEIWRRAENFLNTGRMLEACQEAVKLKNFKETPTYPKAEKVLAAHGISIDDPLGSFTVQQIIRLQNDIEAQRVGSGNLPSPGPRTKYKDAWGRPLRVELVTRPGFIYLIRSAGRDGKWMTENDYVVGMRAEVAEDPLRAPIISESAGKAGRESLLRGGGTQVPAQQRKPKRKNTTDKDAGKDEEHEITLDDLLKK